MSQDSAITNNIDCPRNETALQTVMPHKMVVTRSKGNSPPEDVITLRDAALSLDEKKGIITIGVAGKATVWRGLTTEDTFKWHDALLSAISECGPI
jgi:hypothetical protein